VGSVVNENWFLSQVLLGLTMASGVTSPITILHAVAFSILPEPHPQRSPFLTIDMQAFIRYIGIRKS